MLKFTFLREHAKKSNHLPQRHLRHFTTQNNQSAYLKVDYQTPNIFSPAVQPFSHTAQPEAAFQKRYIHAKQTIHVRLEIASPDFAL